MSAIAFNQAPQIIGAVAYVVLIPRTLGADLYGQFAFVFAVFAVFHMLGELGYQEVFSRFLPEVRHRSGEAGIRAMVRALFGVKLLVGLGLGLAAGLAARLLGGWITPWQAALIGLSVTARVWTMAAFPLLLGLGETLKWTVEGSWRQVALTLLLLAIVQAPSLTQVLIAMAVDEIFFLLLGWWWVRGWLGSGKPEVRSQSSEPPVSDLRPPTSALLRFGFTFSLANFALALMFRAAPIVVEKLTASHLEVGFFDLAQGGLLLLYILLGQVAYSFVPLLTQLRLEGRPAEVDLWLGRFVRYAGILVALAAGGMWAVAGPIAPFLFGAGFAPAANTIRAVAVGLLPLPVAWASVILSAVEKRPTHMVRAALAGLAIFLTGATALRVYASTGIAFAFGLALAGYAVGFGKNAARAVRAGGGRWGITVGAAGIFLIFLFLPLPSLWLALGFWAAAAAVYTLAILGLRVIAFDEIRQIVRALRR